MSVYTNKKAYIIGTGSFLPNDPVSNDQMEDRLGKVNNKASRYRQRILSSNGIKHRHYAINPAGETTHLTEELAAESITNALYQLKTDAETVNMFAVGTTLPDLLAPGIASMVHGRVGRSNADILSTAGICGAGAAAFKAAAMSVISGQHKRAIACGVERPSVIMRGHRFEQESEIERDETTAESFQYFHADFLRWMLSDGAGTFVIDNAVEAGKLALNIEWIETNSFAHRFPTCMYMGSSDPNQLSAKNTWLEQVKPKDFLDFGFLLLRQDTKLLAENIVDIVVEFALDLRDKFGLPKIDHFLPHISSFFFREKLAQRLESEGLDLPLERWFTNLEHKGNTGAASIFIMLDELFHSGKLKDGEKILLMIPESGRFSVTYALLSVEQH